MTSNLNAGLTNFPLPAACVNWRGLDTFRANVVFQGSISGNLTGGVIASGIFRLDVAGDILASPGTSGLTPSDSAGSIAPFIVAARNIYAPINARAGNIDLVEVGSTSVPGVLRADVSATNTTAGGSVNVVRVYGDAGQPSQLISIIGRRPDANGHHIRRVEIVKTPGQNDGNLYANINTGVPQSPHVAMIWLLVGGDLGGTNAVVSMSVFFEFTVGRDLVSTVNFNTPLLLFNPLNVGRSLTGQINLPPAGLTGQVIINQQNVSGAWSGAVTVGGTTLSPTPSYTNLASAIGGGAAGLARFDLHGQSSAPVSGGLVKYYPAGCPNNVLLCPAENPGGSGIVNDNTDRWALIRHYGPVQISGSESGVVTVERRAIGGTAWVDVSSNYRAYVYSSGAGSDAGARVLCVRTNSAACADQYWPLGYDFRIRPVAGRLKSSAVAGTPDVSAYTYTFRTEADCGAGLRAYYDTTGDGRLTDADLSGWAASPRDYNRDGATDAGDMQRLVVAIANAGG